MRAENNLIALLVAICDFLGGIKDVHIESFLTDWPSAICITRPVLPHGLPVLSWLPAAVKAAGKNTEGIVKMVAAQANRIPWGQTYSAQDFGVGFTLTAAREAARLHPVHGSRVPPFSTLQVVYDI